MLATFFARDKSVSVPFLSDLVVAFWVCPVKEQGNLLQSENGTKLKEILQIGFAIPSFCHGGWLVMRCYVAVPMDDCFPINDAHRHKLQILAIQLHFLMFPQCSCIDWFWTVATRVCHFWNIWGKWWSQEITFLALQSFTNPCTPKNAQVCKLDIGSYWLATMLDQIQKGRSLQMRLECGVNTDTGLNLWCKHWVLFQIQILPVGSRVETGSHKLLS